MKVRFFRDIILENGSISELAFTYYELCQELKVRAEKGMYDYLCHRGEAHNLLMNALREKVDIDMENDRDDVHEAVMEIFGGRNEE